MIKLSWPNSITILPMNYFFECRLLMLKSQCSGWIATITYIIWLFTLSILYVYTNLSVVCFFICLYFIFDCALLLFCAQAWHGKTLSSWNDPIFFCSLHWRNLSSYNKITTTHFKQIRFWWKNVIKFRGKVYSNFFKFVQQLFFLSVVFYIITETDCLKVKIVIIYSPTCCFRTCMSFFLLLTVSINIHCIFVSLTMQVNCYHQLFHSFFR